MRDGRSSDTPLINAAAKFVKMLFVSHTICN